MFDKLYDFAFTNSDSKRDLYIQGDYEDSEEGLIIKKNQSIDLGTYFNSFSIAKWIDYTSIHKLKINLKLSGIFFVDFYGMTRYSEDEVLRLKCDDSIEKIFNVKDFDDFDLIGIRLTALSDDSKFCGGSYEGEFDSTQDIKLGLTICTFKREKYLKSNLDKLKVLTARNKNINVLVVDNGRTLDEFQSDEITIIHNKNFGGAGGFTRGIIEQVNRNLNSHVILMDDDIVIELSAIERLYSMLRHLKVNHQSKFFAGSMLYLERPTIQHENTACFNRIIRQSFGHNYDLTNKYFLCANEHIEHHSNSYAAWWFCCIPINQIKSIGYPLPIFIKCDDMEFSFRNHQQILTLNGIGVWHQSFESKSNLITDYFGNRNTLLMNHFADGCNKFTFSIAVIARVIKNILKLNFDGIRMLEYALHDLNKDLETITSSSADEFLLTVKNLPLNKNFISTLLSIFNLTYQHYLNYNQLDDKFKSFRINQLSNQSFWKKYLMLED